MAARAAGQLFSGLLLGAAVGTAAALVLASRTEITAPGEGTRAWVGPTPFEPANIALRKARKLVDEVRTQIRFAVDEGKKTASETRGELTRRFEDARNGGPSEEAPKNWPVEDVRKGRRR